MRNLLKNKKVFFTLILGICIGLFLASKGLQNYYLNQQTENVKVAAENTKKTDKSNETKNELQKNEDSNPSEGKSNSTSQQSKTDSNKISNGSNTSKSTGTNNNSGNGTNGGSSKSGGSSNPASPEKANFIVLDAIHNKTLAKAYLDISGKKVGDVTRDYLDSKNINYEDDNGYMAMIFGLWEKDNGDNSGWCYYVNGAKPSVGENSYTLKSGDIIEWNYVADGLK